MIFRWANDGVLQANACKMLVNDGEMLVNGGERSVGSYTHFTIWTNWRVGPCGRRGVWFFSRNKCIFSPWANRQGVIIKKRDKVSTFIAFLTVYIKKFLKIFNFLSSNNNCTTQINIKTNHEDIIYIFNIKINILITFTS